MSILRFHENGHSGYYGQVLIGNTSQYLGKNADPTKNHRWTAYVKGIADVDISKWISKVTFELHSSFPEPKRVVERPPFQVTECGWGEFEIAITVHFVDPDEAAVQFIHPLRLYESAQETPTTKRLFVSERIEDIVFSDNLNPSFRDLLEKCVLSGDALAAYQRALPAQQKHHRPYISSSSSTAVATASSIVATSSAVASTSSSQPPSAQRGRKRKEPMLTIDEKSTLKLHSLTPAEQAEYGNLQKALQRVRTELQSTKDIYAKSEAEVDALRNEISQLDFRSDIVS